MMDRPLIIIGAGGHAKVVLDTALSLGYEVLGLADANTETHGNSILDTSVAGDDEWVETYLPETVMLGNGIGSIDDTEARQRIYSGFRAKGYKFATLVHPSAMIGRDVELGNGTVVMAGAVIQPGCRIGDNVIINTGARVDHDSRVGDHSHIAPGAVLSGSVQIGENAHIGTGATIVQSITIGDDSLVAAGAVVVKNAPRNSKIIGMLGKDISS